MSVPGVKLIAISLAPRIECDRTRVTPGTTLTASSSGRVMLNTTCRAPRVDPSATILIREKLSSG